ncbi:putative E3 ubiquitin-protein ligase XBAT35 isoform X2 [Rhododendron vialii]|uniref:putative E3 ubiquitin-protein ligase XBAT35 isoform X2 n=1 Tax=Rhododendron vialii TaxID=182163 RepID=UPI00265E3FE2|nr:putative E3 ubiquitin-protein ligase XBAT35 isoform X2 [Rhododendron vialii]
MGQQQSKEELLYENALNGNIEAVKSLCSEGAGLEWVDKDGKTPLIVACMDPERFISAKTLIELGANVNAYRPGLHAGTPLHHAAKRGLDHTVKLLLSHGANPLVRNDDGQTPLTVARSRGFVNVVRAIENHICFFSGWLREFYGPSFLEAFAPQLLSRKIWAVVVPCGSHNPQKPLKLELVIYSSLQDAQPRTVVALWKADIEELKFHQSDATLIIFDKFSKTRYKFASASGCDKQQIELLYNACRGIPQVMPPQVPHDSETSAPITESQTAAEAAELAMAINASIQSAMEDRLLFRPNDHPTSGANIVNGWGATTNDTSQNGLGSFGGYPPSEASSSGWMDKPTTEEHNGWGVPESTPTRNPIQAAYTPTRVEFNGWGVPESTSNNPIQATSTPTREEHNGWGVPESTSTKNPIQATHTPNTEEDIGWGVAKATPSSNPSQAIYTPHNIPPPVQTPNPIPVLASSAPSAPPLHVGDIYDGPIHYPSIDYSPVDFSVPCVEQEASTSSEAKDGDEDSSSSCVICWEAPVEGACIPCGHMAGCMSCLDEIKTKKGDCPVCRAKIIQVIRIYAV